MNTHPLTIPRWWKWIMLALSLILLTAALYAIWHAGGSACESEAHLSDLCDPYLPGIPGREGR
ncbi:MAG: hypothetical protein Q7U76_12995 [Nitrospirota bacterium]|nr:hypothetical protein [Nitrospirota bacterium]